MKIAIFTADSNGGYPVPASKGGAVSTLIEHLVSENNKKKLLEMEVLSFYEERAVEKSQMYPYVSFTWVKVPKVISLLDTLLFSIILKFFKKKKAISFRSILGLIYYIINSSIWLRKHKCDKVVVENNIPMAWIIKLSNYKGEVWYHLHNLPRTNAKCLSVFGKSNFLCVSNFISKKICEQESAIGEIPREKCFVLYNCVDTILFRKKEDVDVRLKYGIKTSEKILLFVGRLSEEKGVDKLLGAIKLIPRDDVRILIVGSLIYGANVMDSYQMRIKEMAEELGNKVIFTGYIPQSELPCYYNSAYISVLPSLWEEPAGLTMIESMACGTPVITTSQGGIPEYVRSGAIVLPINENLEENIAKNVEMLLSDKSIYEKMCDSAIVCVQENFTPEKYFMNFYEKIK